MNHKIVFGFGLVLIAVSAAAAQPFDPTTATVTVADDANCFVNGQNWGMPGDVAANNPQLASKVNLAFIANHQKVQADAQATIRATRDAAAKEIADAQAAAAKQIAESQATAAKTVDEAKAASAAAIAANAKELSDVKSALTEANARLEAAAEQIAALQKQLRDLQAAQQGAQQSPSPSS